MKTGILLSFSAAALLAFSSIASATTVVIATDPSASGTFTPGDAGKTADVGYTINMSDNGTSLIVSLTTDDLSSYNFANLYFDTNADSATQLGSTVGFEINGSTVTDAFIPGGAPGTPYGGPNPYGVSSVETFGANSKTITLTVANSFFLTDPQGLGFPVTPDGAEVSLHISQSFGYDVVGQSYNFQGPEVLGIATINAASPVPEPAGLAYMAISSFGMLAEGARRLRNRKRA